MTTSSRIVIALRAAALALLPLSAVACDAAPAPEAESPEDVATTQSELGLLPIRCERLTFPVSLAEGQPSTYNVVGWLCARGSIEHRTVQVLLHGATYGHVYWDFPYEPQRYSYVRALTAAGYATLALDRIGVGESDHPPPFDVTIQSNAHVVHQVVQKVRSGTLDLPSLGRVGGRRSRVMLVGHSLGTIVSIREAATYHDVDGLILTGFLHNEGPGLDELTLNLFPASLDPHFAGRNIPPGYLTTLTGKRGEPYFYHAPKTDPEVVSTDEATKETATPGEFGDFWASAAMSPQIDVPVLSVVGDVDRLFCDPTCSGTGLVEAEQQFFSPAARLRVVSIPKSSHNLNLHEQAPVWYGIAAVWSALNVGVDTRWPPFLGH